MDSSHVPFVKLLLAHGANTSLQDNMGHTALMKSVDFYGYYGFNPKQEYTLTLLVKIKKDLEIKDRDGKTALTYAEEPFKKNPAIIEYLKEKMK